MKDLWIITFSIELLEGSLESYNKVIEIIESTCSDYFKVNKLTYLVRITNKYEKSPYETISKQLDKENIYANLLIFRTSCWEFWCNCDSKKVFENNKNLSKWLNMKK